MAQVFRKGTQVSADIQRKEQQREGQGGPLPLEAAGLEGIKGCSSRCGSSEYSQEEAGYCLAPCSYCRGLPAFLCLCLMARMLEFTEPISHSRCRLRRAVCPAIVKSPPCPPSFSHPAPSQILCISHPAWHPFLPSAVQKLPTILISEVKSPLKLLTRLMETACSRFQLGFASMEAAN